MMHFIMHGFGPRSLLITMLIISFVSIDHVSFIDCLPLSRVKRAFSYIANETACTVDHIIYKDGDPIPTDDPCETCRCRPPGFTCILRHCEVKSGCRAIRRIGECCPSYQCGCEHNGQYFKDGDRIHNAESPCYSCYCQGSSITCSLADCQFRFDCEPEYVVGECCPRYDHCPSPSTSVKISSTTRSTLATADSSMLIINQTVTTAKNQESVELSTESLTAENSSLSSGGQVQVTTSSSLILDDDDDTPFQLRTLSPQTNSNRKESRQPETTLPSTITTVAPDLTIQSEQEKTTTKSVSVQDLRAVPQTTTEFPESIMEENGAQYDRTTVNITSITEIPQSSMVKINDIESKILIESNSTETTNETAIILDNQIAMSKFSGINYKKLDDSISESTLSIVTTTENPDLESYANTQSETVFSDVSHTTSGSLDSNAEKTDHYYFITTEQSPRQEDDRLVEEAEAEKEMEKLSIDKTPDTVAKTNGTEQSVSRQDDNREPVTEAVKVETLSSSDITSTIDSIETGRTESMMSLAEATTTTTMATTSANN